MSSRAARLTRPGVFALLMLAAAITSLLPPRWTSWTGNLLQPLAWVQWLASGTTRTSAEQLAKPLSGQTVPIESYQQLQQQLAEATRQLEHQLATLDALAQRVDELTGLRDQLRDAAMHIILGRVIGGDTAPGRETLVITPGSLGGLAVGQWVVAGRRVDRTETATGRELVARQWLIGRIADVQTHIARVRLTTDPAFGPIKVWLAKPFAGGPLERFNQPCVLEGAGAGRMIIRQSVLDAVTAEYTHVLMRIPGPVPVFLTTGQVVAARPRSDSPLHFDLDIRPPGDARRLEVVYVLQVAAPLSP